MPGRILVVDDEASLASLLQRHLTRHQYDVQITGTGRECLATLGQAGPPADLVILDLTLPDMDGLEVLRSIRERFTDLPVLLCSGHPLR